MILFLVSCNYNSLLQFQMDQVSEGKCLCRGLRVTPFYWTGSSVPVNYYLGPHYEPRDSKRQ